MEKIDRPNGTAVATAPIKTPPVIYQSPWGHCPNLFYGNIATLMTESPYLKANPDKKVFIDAKTDESLTSSQYIDAIGRFAYILKNKYSIGWDDVVCLFAPNSIYTSAIHLGTLSRGAVLSPANIAYNSDELRHQLEVSRARVIIVAPHLREIAEKAFSDKTCVEKVVLIDEVIQDIKSTTKTEAPVLLEGKTAVYKDAYYCFSSGTSGVPKGVMSTHHNMTSNIQQQEFCFSKNFLSTSNVYGAVLPMSHIFGLMKFVFTTPYVAATIVVFPKFEFEVFLQKICHYKITTLHLVPPIIVLLAKSPLVDKYPVHEHIKNVFSGAAPLGKEVIEAAEARVKGNIVQGYGLTESSPVTHMSTWDDNAYNQDSIGWLIASCEARLVDEDGNDVPNGHPGELWIRGPNIMKGYLRNPEATAATLTPDGFLRTGDVAVMDKTGQYYIVDRIKELIKSKGHQVAPAELEAILLSHPDVDDAAVVGYHVKEEATELPRAFLVLKPNAKPLEIKKWFDSKVARHKQLWGGIVLLDAVPKSASGKILRRHLRNRTGDVAIGYKDNAKAKL